MRTAVAAVVAVVMLGAFPVQAEPAVDCATAADVAACARDDLEASARRMNRAYQDLQQALEAPARPLLRNAQRLWVNFREAECRFQSERRTAADGMVFGLACRAALTRARADTLAAQLERGR